MNKRIIAVFALLILAGFSASQVLAQEAQSQDPPQSQDQVQMQNQSPDQSQGQDQGQDQSQMQDPSQQGPPQDQQNPQQGQDAQATSDAGVARVSMIRGDISTQRGDSGQWQAAALNVPLVNGDKVSAGDNSRAEVQLDYADIARLDSHAAIGIATLDRKHVQIQVSQGQVNFSILRGAEADAEIDTPNVAIHPAKRGRYTVQVNSDSETQLIVREGEADVTTPQGTKSVHKGDAITIRGTGNDSAYKVSGAPRPDDFDKWSADRDRIIVSAASWSHTDQYYTGSNDLDSYGSWVNAPGYGSVWQPSVASGWAPYTAGRWSWQPYYGWTWISAEPWGWAPYHYGRWFLNGNAWAWWPGPIGVGFYGRPYYPIWAPAYVSFFGWRGGFGFGVGFGWGGFGWLPIGPGDWFHPWWGGYRGRFGAVNITHITINNFHNGFGPLRAGGFSTVHNLATSERLRQSVAHTTAGNFGHGATGIGRGITAEQARGAQAMTGNVPVTPTKDSLRTSDKPASRSSMPSPTNGQHFAATHTPAVPHSFSQESAQVKQAIQHDAGQMSSESTRTGQTANTDRTGTTSTGALANNHTSSTQSRQNGTMAGTQAQTRTNTNAFSNRAPSSTAPRSNMPASPSRPSAQNTSGWQRFAQQTHPNGPSSTNRPASNYNSPSRYSGSSSSPYGQSASRYGTNQTTSRYGTNQTTSRYGSTQSAPRYGSSQSPSRGNSYSRPPLDMSKPIVNSRGSNGNYGSRPSYGGSPSGSRPSYGGGSQPSSGGSHSAPSGGGSHGDGSSHPSGGGGGGSHGGGHGR